MSPSHKSPTKPKAVIYNFSEVEVFRWEMVGVVRGSQQFEFEVFCPHKAHLGTFHGTTKVGNSFVLALKAYPDILYDVSLRVTPSGVCTMTEALSFNREG